MAAEWDYERNVGIPENYGPNFGKKVWWICPINKCGCDRYEASIPNRVKKKGCPYCINKKLCPHNNLLVVHPDLCKEWDYKRNEKGPENYAPGSNKKVWWICPTSDCDCHRYEAVINMRTSQNTRCPYCHGKKLCPHNNLLAKYPNICKEM